MSSQKNSSASPPSGERRTFVAVAAAIAGGLVAAFPFAAGLGVLLDPLRKRAQGESLAAGESSQFVPVCPLDQLPADGLPRRFSLVTNVVDAWTHRPNQPIGAVYLVRSGDEEPKITAFITACPHLGCAVEFNASAGQFECPCHKSGFAMDGSQVYGPSRRGLDSLDVKLERHHGQNTVWVAYQRFRTGLATKEPIA